MSVREAQSKINSKEFSEWIAYFRNHPFTDDRDNYLTAQICYIIANVFSKKKVKYRDLLMKFKREKKDPKDLLTKWKSFVSSNNQLHKNKKRH